MNLVIADWIEQEAMDRARNTGVYDELQGISEHFVKACVPLIVAVLEHDGSGGYLHCAIGDYNLDGSLSFESEEIEKNEDGLKPAVLKKYSDCLKALQNLNELEREVAVDTAYAELREREGNKKKTGRKSK